MKKIIIILLLILSFIQAKPGTTSANFLKMSWGARPASLGNAYVGLGEDINSMFYNPAGIASIENLAVTMMYNRYIYDVNSGLFGFVKNIRHQHVIGCGWLMNQIDNIEGRTRTQKFTEYFNAKDIMLVFSYAYIMNKQLRLGANTKIINQQIEDHSGYTAAVDFGSLYKFKDINIKSISIKKFKIPAIHFDEIRAGLTVQNLGLKLKLKNEGFILPIQFTLGSGISIFDNRVIFGLDVSRAIDNNFDIATGIEINPYKYINIRFGYKHNLDGSKSNFFKGYSFGLGFYYEDLSIDYALVPSNYFGMTHKISLSLYKR